MKTSMLMAKSPCLSINFGLVTNYLDQKTKWLLAAIEIFYFRSMCEQHKLSIYTNRTVCTKCQADWTTLKNWQL